MAVFIAMGGVEKNSHNTNYHHHHQVPTFQKNNLEPHASFSNPCESVSNPCESVSNPFQIRFKSVQIRFKSVSNPCESVSNPCESVRIRLKKQNTSYQTPQLHFDITILSFILFMYPTSGVQN